MKFKRMMRRYVYLFCLCLCCCSLYAQEADSVSAYLQYPSFPKYSLLRTDSVLTTCSEFVKGRKTILMVFSTDCDFCKRETDSFIANMPLLRHVGIVMAAFNPLNEIRAYSESFDLKRFDNIMVGRDVNYFLPFFYRIVRIPFLALYDEKGKLVTVFRTSTPVAVIVQAFAKHAAG